MKGWKYAVTFEQPMTGHPVTVRGEVGAKAAPRAASMAVREAKKAVPRKHFDSLVVLLEPR